MIDDDPSPMVSGTCPHCGAEFCNVGGHCYSCERWIER